MGKIRHILVPVDFSNPSINALKYAIEVAKAYGADIFLLHAYRLIEPQGVADQAKNLRTKLSEQIEEKFTNLSKDYLQNSTQQVMHEAHIGFPNDVIENFVSKNQIDLIVIGATGEGQTSPFFGETVISIVDISSVPILVVPSTVNYKKWDHVLSQSSKDNLHSTQNEILEILRDRNIYIKEATFNETDLERFLFEDQGEVDLLAISHDDFHKIEKTLSFMKEPDQSKTVPIPLLIHH